jgi:uncharacterized membrane protein
MHIKGRGCLLSIHHVRDDLGGPLSWDLGFLAFGFLLVIGGWALYRSSLPARVRAAARHAAVPGAGS